MATRSKYAQQYLRWHSTYEKRALKELLITFKTWMSFIKWDDINETNYKAEIDNSFNIELMNETYFKIYYEIGMVHGARVGKAINLELKAFTLEQFATIFEMNVGQYLRQFGVNRIVTVRKQFFEYIVELIGTRLEAEMTLPEITREIHRMVNRKDFYRWQAQRIARTESTASSNFSATQAGGVSGFVMEKEWIATMDARTRRKPDDIYDHREMDGVKVGTNDKFIFNPKSLNQDILAYPGDPRGHAGNVINCYLPDTIISSNILNGQKAWYSGKVVEIITSRGEVLTITPNHGILTNQGFVKAKDIKIGHNLICNKINTNPIFRLINNYIKKKIFTAENIFSALNKFWLSEKFMVTRLDFDTDGESMDGDVNIVYPKVKLRDNFISSILEYINQFKFKSSNSQRVVIARNGPFNLFGSTNKATFRRFMSFLYLSFPCLFRHFRPFKKFGFGLAAHLNTERFKTPSQGNSGDVSFIRELVKADARLVTFDHVINIRYLNFSGHVYDFTSSNGVNITNNIYTSNCRCTVAIVAKRDKEGNLIPTQ